MITSIPSPQKLQQNCQLLYKVNRKHGNALATNEDDSLRKKHRFLLGFTPPLLNQRLAELALLL